MLRRSVMILVAGGVAAGLAQVAFHTLGMAPAQKASAATSGPSTSAAQTLQALRRGGPRKTGLNSANVAGIARPLPPPQPTLGMPQQIPVPDLGSAHEVPNYSWYGPENYNLGDLDPGMRCTKSAIDPTPVSCQPGGSSGFQFQQMAWDAFLRSPNNEILQVLSGGFAKVGEASDAPGDSPPPEGVAL